MLKPQQTATWGGWVWSPMPSSYWQLAAAGKGGAVFLKAVAPAKSTALQSEAPQPTIYGQHKLALTEEFKTERPQNQVGREERGI